ncbi:hypothetical protein ACILG0_08760 [Pseudomonadota bacterium AL_CKDN230030165-1A_HGKHYDSX7]
MPRLLSVCHAALALTAALCAGTAHAATPCPQAADIVRAIWPSASGPDARGRMPLGDSHSMARIPLREFESVPRVACKIWPADNHLMLAAVPVMADVPDSNDGNAGDLGLYVLDAHTLQVRQSLRITGLMTDDAIRIFNVTLDTARYSVDGKRAFGVRIERANESQPNPFQDTSLRLFVPDGDTLRMALDGVSMERLQGEYDTHCKGEYIRTRRTLAMSGRNLMATEVVTTTRADEKEGKCVEETVDTTRHRYTLPYEDGQFLIPIALVSVDNE